MTRYEVLYACSPVSSQDFGEDNENCRLLKVKSTLRITTPCSSVIYIFLAKSACSAYTETIMKRHSTVLVSSASIASGRACERIVRVMFYPVKLQIWISCRNRTLDFSLSGVLYVNTPACKYGEQEIIYERSLTLLPNQCTSTVMLHSWG